MVQKAGKYGISSGNTFKVPSCRYLRRYAKSCFIIRHTLRQEHDEEFDFGLGDLDLSCDGVPFSLNKKGRWSLPDLIREEILDGGYEEFGIQLVERHDITKSANCVSLCSKSDYVTKRKLRKVKERSYFCKNSVTEWERKARLRLGLPVPDSNNQVFDEPSQVIYDVSYPAPDTCSLIRDSKSIAFQSNFFYKQDVDTDTDERPRPTHRRIRSKQWKRVSKDLVEEVLDGINNSSPESTVTSVTVDSGDELFSSDKNEKQPSISDPIQVSLADLIDKTVRLCNSKKSKRKEKKHDPGLHYKTQPMTKDSTIQNKQRHHVVTFCSDSEIVDRPNNNAERTNTSNVELSNKTHVTHTESSNIPTRETSTLSRANSAIKSTVLDPANVRLPFWEITPSILRRKFGDSYSECECHPRKFVIDISDKVSSLDKYRSQDETANACLVILVDSNNERSTATDCVCKVVLNAKYNNSVSRVKIDTVSDYMDTNIGELINKTLLFVNSLPNDSILPNTNVSPCPIGQNKRDSVGNSDHITIPHVSADTDQTVDERCKPISANVEDIRENRRATFKSPSDDVGFMATTSRTVDESFLLKYFISLTSSASPRQSTVDLASDVSVKCTHCGICFNSIVDKCSATALLSCGHWFCNKCWTEYLNTTIRNRSATLPCPEFECEAEVDPRTAISLVTMPTVIQHALCRYETERDRRKDSNLRPRSSRSKMLPTLPTHVQLVKSLVVSGIQCSHMGDGLEVRGVSLKSARSTRSGGKSRLVMSECQGDEAKRKVASPKKLLRHRWQYIRATTIGDLAQDYQSFAQTTGTQADRVRLRDTNVGVQGTHIVKPHHTSSNNNEERFKMHTQGFSKSHTVVSARHFKRFNNVTINDTLRTDNTQHQPNGSQNRNNTRTDKPDNLHAHLHGDGLTHVRDGTQQNRHGSGVSHKQGVLISAKQTGKQSDAQVDTKSHTVVSARHFKRFNNVTINDTLRTDNTQHQPNGSQNRNNTRTDKPDNLHAHLHGDGLTHVRDGTQQNRHGSGVSHKQGVLISAKQTGKQSDAQVDTKSERIRDSRQSDRRLGSKRSARKRDYPISVKYMDI